MENKASNISHYGITTYYIMTLICIPIITKFQKPVLLFFSILPYDCLRKTYTPFSKNKCNKKTHQLLQIYTESAEKQKKKWFHVPNNCGISRYRNSRKSRYSEIEAEKNTSICRWPFLVYETTINAYRSLPYSFIVYEQ